MVEPFDQSLPLITSLYQNALSSLSHKGEQKHRTKISGKFAEIFQLTMDFKAITLVDFGYSIFGLITVNLSNNSLPPCFLILGKKTLQRLVTEIPDPRVQEMQVNPKPFVSTATWMLCGWRVHD